MKTIEQLVHEAAESAGRAIVFDDHFKLFAERFHALAIAGEHKRLLEGSGEPIVLTESNDGTPTAYTTDQMAAAVLRERERCAKVCDNLEAMALDPMVAFGTAKECAEAIRDRGTK